MNTIKPWHVSVIAFILSGCLLSCSIHHNNAKTTTRTAAYPKVIERAKKDKRYFIMYSGLDTYAVTSVTIEKAKQQFTVHLNRVDSLHSVNFSNPNASGEKQVHIYMQDSASYTLDEPHTLPLRKVARIELID